jgi:hypothetical protein
MLSLPGEDSRFLDAKCFDWRLEPNGAGGYLILHGFPVNPDRFDRSSTDILILIPRGYPMARLDMFFADPWVRFHSGQLPAQADVPQEYLGRRWQRFSRHLKEWRAGQDGLPSFLALIAKELQSKE